MLIKFKMCPMTPPEIPIENREIPSRTDTDYDHENDIGRRFVGASLEVFGGALLTYAGIRYYQVGTRMIDDETRLYVAGTGTLLAGLGVAFVGNSLKRLFTKN